ncbi:MAG: hypothetical protein V8Q28_01640, partial [Alistipes sp.]
MMIALTMAIGTAATGLIVRRRLRRQRARPGHGLRLRLDDFDETGRDQARFGTARFANAYIKAYSQHIT